MGRTAVLKNPKVSTFMLDEESQRILRALAEKQKISQGEVIRRLIKQEGAKK